MAAYFTVVKQRNPRNPSELIYFPRSASAGEVDMEEVIHKVEMISTVSGADVVAVNRAEADIMARGLLEGKIVRLGDIGDFRLTFQANASKSEEEVTSKSIVKTHIIYTPGYPVRQQLRRLTFKKL